MTGSASIGWSTSRPRRRPEASAILIGYTRPAVAIAEFRDDDGAVIPYGERWTGMPPEDAYGVVTHPERYQPLVDVARSLVDQLQATYRVRAEPGEASRFEHPSRIVETVSLAIAGSLAESLMVAITDFPGVMVRTADGAESAFPPCGCDSCDEDVLVQIDDLEKAIADVAIEWPLR